MFANLLLIHIFEILHLHKYSDPLPWTLLKHLWRLQPQRYKLGTPVFVEFLQFFSADPIKLCQFGWGASLHSFFRSSEMFDQVQVRALAGTLNDIQRLVAKLLQRFLGCVLRVVVLLEGETVPKSEILIALEQCFYIKDLCTLLQLSFP
jgi:hypothetical protein